MTRGLLSIACALALLACGEPEAPSPDPPAFPPGSPGAVVMQYQCNRCHDAQGHFEPAVRDQHCVKCHQDIFAGAFDGEYDADAIARWRKNITSLPAVPSLTAIAGRVRRDWFVRYLQQPHDLRPALKAQMPRLDISPEDAETIARFFYGEAADPPAADVPQTGDIARGRTAFVEEGCHRCHLYGGTDVPDGRQVEVNSRATVWLAPDLRHARDRLTPAALSLWLTDPRKVKPDTQMPRPVIDAPRRADLIAFILRAPLQPAPAYVVPQRLPLLERRVTYAEVEKAVFKKVCWHCHSDPAPVGGDGGPGNTGGFGYRGVGLDLGSYDAILRGGKDVDGRRVDYLAKNAAGVPRLVAVMWARHTELAGQPAPGLLGMPLGLPPLSPEQIQLVHSWITQGCPKD